MFKLEDRKKARAHLRKVSKGEVFDPVAMYGTDKDGNVIGDKGEPVEGTAAKGYKTKATGTAETTESKPDYSSMGTHAELDAALGNREKPEGWDTKKVAEKQAWLATNPPTNSGGW